MITLGMFSRLRDAVGAVASLGCVLPFLTAGALYVYCYFKRVDAAEAATALCCAAAVVWGRTEGNVWGGGREKERERFLSLGDPYCALRHPDMAKRGTPTHPFRGAA